MKNAIKLAAVICTLCAGAHLESVQNAVAVVSPTNGNSAKGIVVFTSMGDTVRVVADLDGLSPGRHGFHIHDFGDIRSADGSSVGEHFNPTNKKHGCPESPEHHVGDMGNVVANDDGHAHFEIFSQDIALDGPNSVVGRAVVVHGGPDDCVTQPSGNSGPKVGIGIVGIAK